MRCLTDEELRLIAAQEAGALLKRLARTHLGHCENCRSRLDEESAWLRKGLGLLAGERGCLPPDPGALKDRITKAVERDRARRAGSRPAGALRRVLVSAAAVAAVVLLLLSVRFLGDTGWKGCLDSSRGTLLLANNEPCRLLDSSAPWEIPEGAILYAIPGGTAELDLGEDRKATLTGNTLLALGGADAGARPVLARGSLSVTNRSGKPLEVNAGGEVFEVEGEATFEVLPDDPDKALRFVRGRGGKSLGALILVRAVRGTVSHADLTVPAGASVSILPNGERTAVVRSEEGDTAGTDDLDPDEQARAVALVSRDPDDAVRGLLDAARDPDLADEDRALAMWLLGELGESRVADEVRQILADPANPTAVRAAAVRTLSVLLPDSSTDVLVSALRDGSDAVAEAASQALSRLGPDEAGRLSEVAGDPARPAYLRALCAARALQAGATVPLPVLLELSTSADPDAVALAELALGRVGPEVPDRELLDIFGSNSAPALRAAALRELDAREDAAGTAEAVRVLANSTSPVLLEAAVEYLASVAPDALRPFLADLLAGAPSRPRTAALKAVAMGKRSFDQNRYRARASELIEAQDTPPDDVLFAIRIAPPGEAVLLRLLDRATDPGVKCRVLQLLPGATGRTLGPILAATEDENALVREYAWRTLVQRSPETAVRAAMRALDEGTLEDPRDLLPALGESLGGEGAASLLPLLSRLTGPEFGTPVRIRAAEYLLIRGLQSEAARYALLGLLDREQENSALRPAVALFAARVAAQLGRDDPFFGELLGRIRGVVGLEQARARLALVEPIDQDEIAALLGTENVGAAIWLLLHVGDDEAARLAESLRSAVMHPDGRLRAAAVLRLARLEGEGPTVLNRMRDPDPLVRVAAAAALLRRGQEVAAALETLRGTGILVELPEALDEQAARSLGLEVEQLVRKRLVSEREEEQGAKLLLSARVRREAARSQLVRQALTDIRPDRPEVERLLAVEVLSHAAGRTEIPVLLEVARDADPRVAARAEEALSLLLGRTEEGLRAAGRAGSLEDWWRDRKHAMAVPVIAGRSGEPH